MADLSEIQSAGTTKIVGSDASGSEQTPVQATASGALHVNLRNSSGTQVDVSGNGDLSTSDILDASGVQGAISVGTSAVAVRVGGSNLTNRKNLSFWNNGNATLYWGYTNSVTTSTGTPVMRNQQVIGDWGPNTTIYIIAASGTHDVRVTEGA